MVDNRAYIRKNKNKRDGKKDPDLNGSGKINGVEMWVSGWFDEDTDRDGQPVVDEHGKQQKVISLTFKPKEQQGSAPQASESVPPHGDEDEWGL